MFLYEVAVSSYTIGCSRDERPPNQSDWREQIYVTFEEVKWNYVFLAWGALVHT